MATSSSTGASGAPLSPEVWYRCTFKNIRERAGLRQSIGIHSLRHTYASLLIAQGENIKYVSRQLGHTTVQITVDTYGHLFEKNSASAMLSLNGTIDTLRREAEVAASGLRVVGS